MTSPDFDDFAVVVLDMDDTVYLEREYVRSGFEALDSWLADRLGVDDIGDTLWRLFEDGVRGDTINRALRQHGLDDTADLVGQLVRTYRSHSPTIELEPDATSLIDRLGPSRLALITDGPADSQWAKIRALGLDRKISNIVVTADLGSGHSKPSKLPFEVVRDAVDLPHSELVYVGDNPTKDFVAPHALGWATIRVRRSLGLHASVPSGTDVGLEVTSLDMH